MTQFDTSVQSTIGELQFDLGTFEGFNFREQTAIYPNVSAQELIDWDHDAKGEAEFWPSGDHAGVSLLFREQNAVSGSELLALDKILSEFEDDSTGTILAIYYALRVCGLDLAQLTRDAVESENVHVFVGTSFCSLRTNAAYELFELYYPEVYAAWEKTPCDGLIFDTDVFLDSPSLSTEEVTIGEEKALLVSPQ